jgi:Ca2+-binding EF-hand superfamily protein
MNKAIESVVLSFAFAGVATAQMTARDPVTNPGNQKVAPQFSSLDTDKDGHVTRDEVKAHADLSASFAALDRNRDSWLSEAELRNWKATSTTDPSPKDSTSSGKVAPETGK